LLPNKTANETFVHKSGAVRIVDSDIYHWGAGLAVTGRIYDIGQKVQSYDLTEDRIRFKFYNLLSQTGGSSIPSCFKIFCLVAFVEEATARNIT